MAQTQQTQNEKTPTIDLEPIGGGKVDVEEATEAGEKIIDIIRDLGKSENDNGASNGPDVPASGMGQTLVTYGMYAVGGVTLTYLIGKALE